MAKTLLKDMRVNVCLTDEFAEDDLDNLSISLINMIGTYEESKHTSVAYLLFTGKFESRYDEMFSSEGGCLIPYSDENDNLVLDVLNKLDPNADSVVFAIEDSVLNVTLEDHDGTVSTKLTLITEKFAESHKLDELIDNYSRRLVIKKLMGTTQPKGTLITNKMKLLFF